MGWVMRGGDKMWENQCFLVLTVNMKVEYSEYEVGDCGKLWG